MATQTRLPNGNGSFTAYTASGGGNAWEDVDDPVGTPDDDATYISRVDSNAQHQFTFSAFTVPAGSTINSVTVHVRQRRSVAGALNGTARVRVNGSNFASGNNAAATSYGDFSNVWSTNPSTTLAWTVDDVNGSGAAPLQEFGIGSTQVAAGEEHRVTQVYVEVDYTPAATGNPWYYYQQQR